MLKALNTVADSCVASDQVFWKGTERSAN